MQRSAQLAPLSRDHQTALAVALRLRRAGRDDLDRVVAAFAAFWADHGAEHFDEEEALLVPALPATDADWAQGVARMTAEHRDLRARAEQLPGLDGAAGVAAAHELGERLAAHVRFEERELFGLLEERLPRGELDALGRRLAELHGAG